MKTLFIKITTLTDFMAFLAVSCNKTNEPLAPNSGKTDVTIDNPENNGMLSYNIPIALAASSNSVANTETVTDQVPYGGITYNVTLECKMDDQNNIVSVKISQDFADATGNNDPDFLNNNEVTFTEYFNGDYPEANRPNGWLARFFLGKIIKNPCVLGRQNVYRDPWWGPQYVVSPPQGDPC